jgi:putative spermidine/putrescine transport system substrate-binding protein
MPGKGGVVLIAAASPCIFKRICICPRRAERAPMLTRRKVMGSVALGAGALGLGIAPPRASADAGQLTFAGFGGTTQDAEKTAWADPFSAATGIQVIQDGPIDMGKIKAQVESGNVLWDVCDVQGPVAYLLAKQGMLEPIDYSVVKREHLDPRFTFDYGVAAFGSSYVLGYNKDVIKDKEPHNWADLFDTKTFPGKRAVFKWMSGAPFEIALPPDKLYPYDVERALAKWATIKKDIVWWSTGAQSQQLLASGETPIGMLWNGRIYALIQGGANVGLAWEQSTPGSDIMIVPKGSKHKAEAMKFLAVATSPKPQADFANTTAFVPLNSESVPLLDKKLMPYMPFGKNTSEFPIDFQYLADNWESLAKRWYAWQTTA